MKINKKIIVENIPKRFFIQNLRKELNNLKEKDSIKSKADFIDKKAYKNFNKNNNININKNIHINKEDNSIYPNSLKSDNKQKNILNMETSLLYKQYQTDYLKKIRCKI